MILEIRDSLDQCRFISPYHHMRATTIAITQTQCCVMTATIRQSAAQTMSPKIFPSRTALTRVKLNCPLAYQIDLVWPLWHSSWLRLAPAVWAARHGEQLHHSRSDTAAPFRTGRISSLPRIPFHGSRIQGTKGPATPRSRSHRGLSLSAAGILGIQYIKLFRIP
jgi:hypothetical protein